MGASYSDVAAIGSTFAFAAVIPPFVGLGIGLGRIAQSAILGAAVMVLVAVAFGAYQVYQRRRFRETHPDVTLR